MNNYNIYRRDIYFDYEKPKYWKRAIAFMSNPKVANLATFIWAVIGTVVTCIGAYLVAM